MFLSLRLLTLNIVNCCNNGSGYLLYIFVRVACRVWCWQTVMKRHPLTHVMKATQGLINNIYHELLRTFSTQDLLILVDGHVQPVPV